MSFGGRDRAWKLELGCIIYSIEEGTVGRNEDKKLYIGGRDEI